MAKKVKIDTTAGSMAYNRLDMQASQVLHMAIEIYDKLDFLFILDYYDDITLFEDENNPSVVSYYQMKTSDKIIQFNSAIQDDWITKMYAHLDNTDWIIKELGLITNCPIHITISAKESEAGKSSTYDIDGAKTAFDKFKPETIQKIKQDIANKNGISEDEVDLAKFFHMRTTLSLERHRDIVEKELGDFLYEKYPRIGMDSVKTIYSTMIDLLTKRQENEMVTELADFTDVVGKKGIKKTEFDHVIRRSMMQALPEAYEVERQFPEEVVDDALRQYSAITADTFRQDETLSKISLELERLVSIEEIGETENVVSYCERIIDLFTTQNRKLSVIRNKMYLTVLCVCIYLNDLRC